MLKIISSRVIQKRPLIVEVEYVRWFGTKKTKRFIRYCYSWTEQETGKNFSGGSISFFDCRMSNYLNSMYH